MSRKILLSVLIGLVMFNIAAQPTPSPLLPEQSAPLSLGLFRKKMLEYAKVSYRESRFLWNWANKIMRGQSISDQENRRAQEIFRTTTLAAGTVLALAAVGTSIGLELRKPQKPKYDLTQQLEDPRENQNSAIAPPGSVERDSVFQEIRTKSERLEKELKKAKNANQETIISSFSERDYPQIIYNFRSQDEQATYLHIAIDRELYDVAQALAPYSNLYSQTSYGKIPLEIAYDKTRDNKNNPKLFALIELLKKRGPQIPQPSWLSSKESKR